MRPANRAKSVDIRRLVDRRLLGSSAQHSGQRLAGVHQKDFNFREADSDSFTRRMPAAYIDGVLAGRAGGRRPGLVGTAAGCDGGGGHALTVILDDLP
jgi:hypothetical protein